jgi:hypothetical protein
MTTLLERQFTVDVALPRAWDHLACIEAWPSWAAHIKKIDLSPAGELGPRSTGVIHLSRWLKPAFRMTEFNLPRNWKWASPFLWLTVHYDHRFEALDEAHTKLTWIIEAQGFGASVLGPLFARIYRRHLDRAIPRLIQEMNSNPPKG